MYAHTGLSIKSAFLSDTLTFPYVILFQQLDILWITSVVTVKKVACIAKDWLTLSVLALSYLCIVPSTTPLSIVFLWCFDVPLRIYSLTCGVLCPPFATRFSSFFQCFWGIHNSWPVYLIFLDPIAWNITLFFAMFFWRDIENSAFAALLFSLGICWRTDSTSQWFTAPAWNANSYTKLLTLTANDHEIVPKWASVLVAQYACQTSVEQSASDASCIVVITFTLHLSRQTSIVIGGQEWNTTSPFFSFTSFKSFGKPFWYIRSVPTTWVLHLYSLTDSSGLL